MSKVLILVLSLCLAPLLVQAQPVTWYPLTGLPDPGRPGGRLFVVALGLKNTLIGEGQFFSFRISPDHTQVLPIVCPNIAGDPTDRRLGPLMEALNNAGTVVGQFGVVQGGVPRNVGILQPEGGDCVMVQGPGVGLVLRGIDDDERSVGEYYISPSLEQGLSSVHGFERAPDGTLTLLQGLCANPAATPPTTEVLWPEAAAVGYTSGHAYCHLNPATNAYVYEGWVQTPTGLQVLRDPDGKTVWVPAVTNDGFAYGSTARAEGQFGGKAWRWKLTVDPITAEALPCPPPQHGGTMRSCNPIAANTQGWIVQAVEVGLPCPPDQLGATGPSCSVSEQFLALYTTPPPPRHKRDNRHRDTPPPPKQKDRHEDHDGRGKGGRHE